MIELSTTNAQVLSAGQSVIFNLELLHTGCTECHRTNSNSVSLTQRNAIYEVSFNCNIGATAADTPAQIALTLDGSPLQETTVIVPTTAAGDLTGVSASTFIETCCCNACNSILLTNTGTEEINVAANARLSIKRIAWKRGEK